MKKIYAIIISFVIAVTSVFTIPAISVGAEEIINVEYIPHTKESYIDENGMEYFKGKDIRLTNVIRLTDEYYAILTEQKTVSELNPDSAESILKGYPDKTVTKYFTHEIHYHDGPLMVRLTTAVTGLYSQVDGGSAQMLSIVATNITGEYANGFSYTTSLSGDTGTLYLYFNGISSGYFRYRIYSNGNIENIS